MRKYLVLLLVAAFAFVAMPAMAQAPAAAPDKSFEVYGEDGTCGMQHFGINMIKIPK